jgi:RNA polymerase sigma-70 factor (ECF subfamily)
LTGTPYNETRWSLVLRASAGSDEALNELCGVYWPAVYAFLRRKNLAPHDAEEVTQEVFRRIAAPSRLDGIAPEKGRFRSFLCACADHEASHFRNRASTLKRGANRVTSLEMIDPENRFAALHVSDIPDDLVFDRAWSLILVNRALDEMRSEYRRLGKEPAYREFLNLLKDGVTNGDFPQIASRLGVTQGNARVMWLRFRASFLENIRSQVEQTLAAKQRRGGTASFNERLGSMCVTIRKNSV